MAAPIGVPPVKLRGWVAGSPSPLDPHFAERAAALPRTYVARNVQFESDPERARAAMLSGSARDVVVAEAPASGAAAKDGTATLAHYDPQEVRISADCAQRCLVVLTDLVYPGWRATIDGAASPVVTTNLLYRGVWMPAGRHEIVHRYHATALTRGAWAGAALLAATLGAALLAQRRAQLRW